MDKRFITFQEMYPKAPPELLDQIGLVRFGRQPEDPETLAKNLRYFKEMIDKSRNELDLLKAELQPEKTRLWHTDPILREHILALRRKDNPSLETVLTLKEGTRNLDLSDDEYIELYTYRQLATFLKRKRDLEVDLIPYFKLAIKKLENPSWEIITNYKV
jgi:hypothetical protein